MSYPTTVARTPPMAGSTRGPRPGGIDRETVENAIELKDVEGLSQGQIVRRRFFRHRGALGRPRWRSR